jgi:hypothetical protein
MQPPSRPPLSSRLDAHSARLNEPIGGGGGGGGGGSGGEMGVDGDTLRESEGDAEDKAGEQIE